MMTLLSIQGCARSGNGEMRRQRVACLWRSSSLCLVACSAHAPRNNKVYVGSGRVRTVWKAVASPSRVPKLKAVIERSNSAIAKLMRASGGAAALAAAPSPPPSSWTAECSGDDGGVMAHMTQASKRLGMGERLVAQTTSGTPLHPRPIAEGKGGRGEGKKRDEEMWAAADLALLWGALVGGGRAIVKGNRVQLEMPHRPATQCAPAPSIKGEGHGAQRGCMSISARDDFLACHCGARPPSDARSNCNLSPQGLALRDTGLCKCDATTIMVRPLVGLWLWSTCPQRDERGRALRRLADGARLELVGHVEGLRHGVRHEQLLAQAHDLEHIAAQLQGTQRTVVAAP